METSYSSYQTKKQAQIKNTQKFYTVNLGNPLFFLFVFENDMDDFILEVRVGQNNSARFGAAHALSSFSYRQKKYI